MGQWLLQYKKQMLLGICIALIGVAGAWFGYHYLTRPVKVGFISTLTGIGADLGVGGRNGTILAIEQANARGGINGRPIELLIRDVQQDEKKADAIVRELISQNVEVIIGPMTSRIAVSLTPLVNSSKTILLSPTVTTVSLTGKDDQFLRAIDDTGAYARKSARYQYEKMRHRSFSVIYDVGNKAYSESWLHDFRQEFEKLGGKQIRQQAFNSGQHDFFPSHAAGLIGSKPDVVLVIGASLDSALICQQLRKIKPDQAIMMSEWGATERFIELAGNAAEGVMASQFIDRNNQTESFQAFLNAYRARFSAEPGFAGLTAYDTANVALTALARRKLGTSLKQTIIDIGSFDGAQSPVRIDRFGDAKRNTYLTTVRNGQFVSLE